MPSAATETYVGVIGGRECSFEAGLQARELGRNIAKNRWILVCGGMSGIMQEACRGVQEENGVAIGILPGHDRAGGNPFLTYSLVTGLGEGRNMLVIKSSDIICAFEGSYGTLSELAFARMYGKPVIGIGSLGGLKTAGSSLSLVTQEVKTAAEAIVEIRKLL